MEWLKIENLDLQETNSNIEVTTWGYLEYMGSSNGHYSVFRIQPQSKYNQINKCILSKVNWLLVIGMEL